MPQKETASRKRRRAWRLLITLAVLVVFLGPAAGEAVRTWPWTWPHWRAVDWSSAGVLPAPAADREAAVYVLSARAAAWRGIFASHAWIVTKAAGAAEYDRWEVVGWGDPVRRNAYDADGRWFGNEPSIFFSLQGAEAVRIIPQIERAVSVYPAATRYRIWPGPNSNTFVAHVARQVDGLDPVLPADALGKDFLLSSEGRAALTGPTPSGTGGQISLYGVVGLTAARREGVMFNLFGLSAGIPFE